MASSPLRGRPPNPAIPGQRYPLGLRVSAEIKERLDNASRAVGRSQSQEAEARIEFAYTVEDAFGGARVMELLLSLANAAKAKFSDDRWLRDPDLFRVVHRLWMEILASWAPPRPDLEQAQVYEIRKMISARAYAPNDERARWCQIFDELSRLPGLPSSVRAELEFAVARSLLPEPLLDGERIAVPDELLPDEPEASTTAPADAENAKVPLDDNDEGT